jgi:hypothetical protein
MGNCLEEFITFRIIPEEIGNMNKCTIIKEVVSLLVMFSTKRTPEPL